MKQFGKSLLKNLSACFFEEICRNCGEIVEVEFCPFNSCQSSIDTTFSTNKISPYTCICFNCAHLVKSTRSTIPFVEHLNVFSIQIPIFYFGNYSGILKKLIRKIKYDDDKLVGCDLGLMLYEVVSYDSAKIQFPNHIESILIPVPLHKERLRERGYNQAEVIAKEFNKQYGSIVDSTILKRSFNTKPQFDLGVEERKSNVVNAFSCTRGLDPNKSYIIIDDVSTTGTTLGECAKQLIKNKAKNIIALSVAIA